LQLTSSLIRPEMFQGLSVLKEALAQLTVDMTIAWIPGHHGTEFNETADYLAKETACDIYSGRLSAPSYISFNDTVKSFSWNCKTVMAD